MRLRYKHTLLALAALACVVGCTDNTDVETKPNTISLSVGLPQTRAMLTQSTFGADGNRIKVYDFVDDAATAHIDSYAGPDVLTNSGLHEDGTSWPFTDEMEGTTADTKQWVPGTHRFFGWLAKDKNMATSVDTPEEFFGSGFAFASKILTIPAKAMTNETPQFDFLYSDITVTQPTNSFVKMNFKHLFTAVSIGVENSTSSFVKIEEFRVEDLPSTRSATINFGGDATVVNYSGFTSDKFTRGLDEGKDPYEISPDNLRSNIFDGSTTQAFMLLWPTPAEYIYSSDKITTSDDGVVTYPETYKMYIKYTADGKTYEKRINFPNLAWEAGKKYHFNIVFADKMVELKTEVKPWEYEIQDIDYTKEGVEVDEGGVLSWNKDISGVDDGKKMVSIINAQPARASFTLGAPIGGSWIVSLVGDVNAFEVSPSTGVIDGQTTTVYVKPLISEAARDYKVQLKFTVRRSDGRMIAADDMIQKGGAYTVVLPRNN